DDRHQTSEQVANLGRVADVHPFDPERDVLLRELFHYVITVHIEAVQHPEIAPFAAMAAAQLFDYGNNIEAVGIFCGANDGFYGDACWRVASTHGVLIARRLQRRAAVGDWSSIVWPKNRRVLLDHREGVAQDRRG